MTINKQLISHMSVYSMYETQLFCQYNVHKKNENHMKQSRPVCISIVSEYLIIHDTEGETRSVYACIFNQAHTCKTLGVVTIPKSLLARMRRCIRVIIPCFADRLTVTRTVKC